MRVRRKSVQAFALAGAVGVWATSALGQVGPLPKGQKWFLRNGLQIQGMVSPFDSFHLGAYQAMNYTAVNWMWESNPGDLGPAPGNMPWARWVSPGSPPADSTDF